MRTSSRLITVISAAALMVGVALPAMAAPGDWRQFHAGGTLSGFNRAETILGLGNVATMTQSWADPIATSGETAGLPQSPAVVGGVVYTTANNGTLSALNASTGATIWTEFIGYGLSSPSVAGDRIVVVGGGSLQEYRASTGALRWSISPFPFSSACPPTVSNGVIYVCAFDGGSPTRSKLYAFSLGGSLLFASAAFEGLAQANVAVDGINAYVSVAKDDNTGAVYEIPISCTTGCTPTFAMPTAGIIQTAPTLHVATVSTFTVVIVAAEKMYAFVSTTGLPLWTSGAGQYGGSPPNGSSPAVDRRHIYVGSSDGKIYSFLLGNGGTSWSTPLPSGSYFASDSAAVANGVVYIGAIDGHLFALSAADGTILWSIQLSGAAQSSPAVSTGHVFVGSGSGNLYAFGLP